MEDFKKRKEYNIKEDEGDDEYLQDIQSNFLNKNSLISQEE